MSEPIMKKLPELGLFPNEPAWFTDIRKTALKNYRNTKLPRFAKVHYEDWQLGELMTQVKPSIDQEMDCSTNDYILCTLATALMKHEKLVEKYYLQKALTTLTDRLVNFSTAFVNAGSFLYIPANTKLTKPILLPENSKTKFEQEISHNLIILGEGAQATIGIQSNGAGTAKTAHRISEIVLEANSHLNLINLDDFTAAQPIYLNRQASVGENAHLNWSIGSFSDGNVIAEMNAELVGRRAVATINNAAITSGKQTQGMNTRVTNFAPHSVGKIRQRGVILDESRLVFNGIGKIIHGAHGTIAEQENRILMLSDKASGDANPILLIDENDVEAGHAASVGRLDKKQLYYLMSRGLSKPTAKRLVVRGFIGELAKKIANPQIRQSFQKSLERKLPNA